MYMEFYFWLMDFYTFYIDKYFRLEIKAIRKN